MATELQTQIETLVSALPESFDPVYAGQLFENLLKGLNNGTIRAAERLVDGTWQTNTWVKSGILLGFRIGRIERFSLGGFPFFDKHTYPLKPVAVEDGVRIVPGGSSIRTGCFIASGVVCMPPMFINVGAYVDSGTMVDSHALIGSCAQIGKKVHVSAAAQIGGVLEPVGAQPVIIEDEVFIGGNCGVYEGCLVRKGAVLAPGVILSGSTRLYDLVNERILTRTEAGPLEIPEYAVVVPGSRTLDSEFARHHGLALYAPIIVKYRDDKTDAATTLETILR